MRCAHLKLTIVFALSALLLSGCFIKPKPISNKEQLSSTFVDFNRAFHHQKPITKPVTLSEAVARALKYNLDSRVREAEIALTSGQLTLAQFDMLPSIDTEFKRTMRNNTYNTLSATGGLGSATVTPNNINTTSYGLSWDILDFGLSYIRAKQQADRVMIAKERRNKIEQQLVQQVVAAYWKAYAAQEMLHEIIDFRFQVKEALYRSKEAERKRVSSVITQLDYQYLLIKSMRRLNFLQMKLMQAKRDLMKLMDVPPGFRVILRPPKNGLNLLPKINVSLQKLDTLALVYRPELRELTYTSLIAKKGVIGAVLEMLPNVKYEFAYKYSNNKFLLNQNWINQDLQASWDLMKVIAGPASYKVAKTRVELEKMKRMAMTISVLTQVRLAYLEYLYWESDYRYSREEFKVTRRLYEHARRLSKAKAGAEQVVIRRGIEALNVQLDRDVAFAKAQESLGYLYQSVGLDWVPLNVNNLPLSVLTKKVQAALVKSYHGGFTRIVNQKFSKLGPVLKQLRAVAKADIRKDKAEKKKKHIVYH